MRDDLVVCFGSLTRASFSSTSLQPLADLVAAQENVSATHNLDYKQSLCRRLV